MDNKEQSLEVAYRGFIIYPAPFAVKLGPEYMWSPRVSIGRHSGGEVRMSSSFDQDMYTSSRDEALRLSIDFGKRIIDGQVPDISIKDL